ncbi:hypothetical protein D3C73_735390 [compost metagenome]
MICAPPFTWARAISEASSNLPSLISLLNFLEPEMFVRSPIMNGRFSGSIYTVSIPETAAGCDPTCGLGGYLLNVSTRARI